ncbi:RdgB/HAM1 family non-canonical purine NTP pyrophosphatase [Candidatus Liberibacter sp.]|uniref:RdgB/HAM1 family non-canonical purine NTP pyrophosphatase n=1 Tax=Candidatus Liberibacter sp. TaxID=34022 RepID=UPI0015F70BE7|nr:RdgB/HAM1 family non-canonical purine NTP pyrophosphatase [Candidatus Liberibacter sp.]MBA5723700.1 RdgB/HAM1 family non-canonical purine NTP pyrophosphatase [Candidatus Liberibacter sp.]
MRRLSQRDIVIASHNEDKINEIRGFVLPLRLLPKSSIELSLIVPEETGETFEENAIIKALSAAKMTGIPALSDDSGLMVDALDGKPGVHSARWAETIAGKRDFHMAMQKIEDALAVKSIEDPSLRSACFISVLCIAWPDGHVENFFGRVEGTIVFPPRGTLGFGYDPIFQPKGCNRTFGEMTEHEKNFFDPNGSDPLSHRARAFKCFFDNCLCIENT